jgi:UDPglucose 6-dehydrogenase
MRDRVISSREVGPVSRACLADFGHEVVSVNKDDGEFEVVGNWVMPTCEPGLADPVASTLKSVCCVLGQI